MKIQRAYIITAIDKRTGERVPVAKPHSYEKTYEMLMKIQSGKYCSFFRKRLYKNPKIEACI